MILFPNAKINLGLNVVSRRPDGYHNIETMFYPVRWADILEIVPGTRNDVTLTVSGRAVDCPPEKNLVVKAYRALSAIRPLPPVDIYLRKVIPDGAGLGGGSADAAFTLRGLNALFELGFSDDELASVAATIGADCPFFIYNRPMFATGIGTEFTPIDINLTAYTIVVVKPSDSVSTKEAYGGIIPAVPATELSQSLLQPVEKWSASVKNDFEASVFPNHPTIARVKQTLIAMGASYASMSGSGSAVFGLFPKADSDTLSAQAAATFGGCDIFVQSLGGEPK